MQRAALDPAEREARAAVRTQVLPGERPLACLPDDDVLAQQPRADRPLHGQLLRRRNRMPVVDQHGILDHVGRSRALPAPPPRMARAPAGHKPDLGRSRIGTEGGRTVRVTRWPGA
jgi:hypothetical protein